jgi:hypothetical protein
MRLRPAPRAEGVGLDLSHGWARRMICQGLAQYLFATNRLWAGNFVRISVP